MSNVGCVSECEEMLDHGFKWIMIIISMDGSWGNEIVIDNQKRYKILLKRTLDHIPSPYKYHNLKKKLTFFFLLSDSRPQQTP
jgi:hypothetical protein